MISSFITFVIKEAKYYDQILIISNKQTNKQISVEEITRIKAHLSKKNLPHFGSTQTQMPQIQTLCGANVNAFSCKTMLKWSK